MSLFGRKTHDIGEPVSGSAESGGQLERAIADLEDEDVNVRASAVQALGEIGGARAAEALLPALLETDDVMILAVGEALEKIGNPAVGPLIAALQQEDPKLRKEAAWSLGFFEDPRIIETLATTLQDPDENVRFWAAAALGVHGDERALAPLINALREGDVSQRGQAARTLAKLGDERAVEPLMDALTSDEVDVRVWAAAALSKLRDARAVEPLIGALADEDWRVRMHAAEALGQIGDPRAAGPLAALTEDESAGVKTAAREAQAKIREVVGPAEREESRPPGPRCAVCGRDLTGQPAMRDNVTGALYCSEHPPF